MKKLITTCLLGSAMVMTGCATQTALITKSQQENPAYTKSQSFYISGIAQQKTVDASEVCGGADKVAKVQSLQTGKDVALSIVTLGIYTPRTANVYCK